MPKIPDMYEVGALYVWKNVPSVEPELRGRETIVTGHAERVECVEHGYHDWQRTDTMIRHAMLPVSGYALAGPGELERKNLPPGEKDMMELIKHTIDNPTPVTEEM